MADDYSRELAALDRNSNQLDDSPDASNTPPQLPPPTPVTAPQDSNDRTTPGGGPLWHHVIGTEFGEVDRPGTPTATPSPTGPWNRGAWGDPLEGWNTQGVALRGVPRGTQVALRNPATGQTVVTTVKDKGPGESTGASVDMLAGTRSALGFDVNYKGPVDVQIVGGPQFSFEKESPTSIAAINRAHGGDVATLEDYRQKYYSQIDKETFNKLADQPGGKKPLDDYVYEKAPPPERLKIKYPQYKEQSDEDAVKNVWNDLGPEEQKKLGTFKDFHDKMFPPGPLDKVIKDLKDFWPDSLHAVKGMADYGTADLLKVLPGAVQLGNNFNNEMDRLVGMDKKDMPEWSKPLENMFANFVKTLMDQARAYEQRAQQEMPNPQSPVGQVVTGVAGGIGGLPAAGLGWALGGGNPAAAVVAASAFASSSKYADLADNGYKNAIPEIAMTAGTTGLMGALFNTGWGRAAMGLMNVAVNSPQEVQRWINGEESSITRAGARAVTQLALGALVSPGKGKLPEEGVRELMEAAKAQEEGDYKKAQEHIDRHVATLSPDGQYEFGLRLKKGIDYINDKNPSVDEKSGEAKPVDKDAEAQGALFYSGMPIEPSFGDYTDQFAEAKNTPKGRLSPQDSASFWSKVRPGQEPHPPPGPPKDPLAPSEPSEFYAGLPISLKSVDEFLTKIFKGSDLERVFLNPESMGEAGRVTGSGIAKAQATREWEQADINAAFRQLSYHEKFRFDTSERRGNYFAQFRRDEMLHNLSLHQRGQSTGNPKMDMILGWYDHVYKMLAEKDNSYGIQYDPLEHYLPHMFESKEEYNRFSQWVRKTYPNFVHEKQFHDIEIAAYRGYKMKSLNPERLMQMRWAQSDQAINKIESLRYAETEGFAYDTKGAPEDVKHWNTYRTPDGKNYYVHPDMEPVIHNVFDPRNQLAAKATNIAVLPLRAIKGISTPFRFALSTYHILHVLNDLEAHGTIHEPTVTGRMMSWLPRAGIPQGIKAVSKYGRLVKLAKEGTHTATMEEKGYIKALQDMGIVLKPSEERTIEWFQGRPGAQAVTQAARTGLGWLSLRPVNKWLFGHMIPSIKAAMSIQMRESLLKEKPWLERPENKAEYMKEMRSMGQQIEARVGEMYMPNLFWNKVARDVGVATAQSLGWQLGFFRIYGGAVKDLTGIAGRAAAKQPLVTERMKYMTAYSLKAATYGAILHGIGAIAWNAAHPDAKKKMDIMPDGMDYLYPSVGMTLDGHKVRLNTMFFTRELASIWYHERYHGLRKGTQELLASKASPGLETMMDLFYNTDFLGRQIYSQNPDDPVWEKLAQMTAHTAQTLFTPFSAPSLAKAQSDPFQAGVGFLGFQQGPQWASRSDTENEVMRQMSMKMGQMTPGEAQVYDARNALRSALENQDTEGVKKAEQQLRALGATDKQIKNIKKKVSTPKAMLDFSFLKEDERNRLLSKMSPEERKEWLKHISPKARREYEQHQARTGATAPLEN